MLRGLGWLVNDPGASFRCRVSPIPAHRFDRALLSALRKGELLSLAWSNVDLQNRVIRVERSRNRERRDIPMTERVFETLKALLGRVDSPYNFADPDGTTRGESPRPGTMRWKPQKSRTSPSRHTFASNLVMAGVDIQAVQVLLGHKRIEMTMLYAHLTAPPQGRDFNS